MAKSSKTKPITDQENPTKKRSKVPVRPTAPQDEHPMGKASAWVLYVIVFLAGSVVMAFEIKASKVMAPYFGSDVYTWGNIIGVILLAMSLGYYLGGRAADWKPRPYVVGVFLIISGVLVSLVPVLSHGVCSWISAMELPAQFAPIIPCLILFVPAATLMATVTPFVLKLSAGTLTKLGSLSGRLSSLSTIGSLTGTFATTLFLVNIEGLGTRNTLFMFGIILAVLGVILMFLRTNRRSITAVTAVIGLIVFQMIIIVWYSLRDVPMLPLFDKMGLKEDSNPKVLVEDETPYHNIAIIEYTQTGSKDKSRIRAMRFDGAYTESSVVLDGNNNPSKTTALYTNQFLLAWRYNQNIKNIAVIGAGGGVGPRDILQWFPKSTNPNMFIDVVDVDGRVLEMAEAYFGYPDDDKEERLASHAIDGRLFFKHTKRNYDLIILDAFSIGGRVPEHLLTYEFFEELKQKLNQGGIILINLNTALLNEPDDVEEPKQYAGVYLSVLKTFHKSFPKNHVFTYPLRIRYFGYQGKGDDDPEWHDTGKYSKTNVIVIAVHSNKDAIDFLSENDFANKYRVFGKDNYGYSLKHYVACRWEPRDVELFQKQYDEMPVLTDDFNPVNLYVHQGVN